MFEFWMTQPYLDTRIPHAAVASVDMTPTMFYYGSVLLTCEIADDECEALGLYPKTDGNADDQAEASALYRAEMAHCI